MKRFMIMRNVLRRTRANRVWGGFLVFFFFCAAVIWLREPEIHTYREALWYCYAVVTTIGFGDIVVVRPLSRILSVALSISAALVVALVTGVIVNYYNQITEIRQKETLTAFLDRLEKLPELSREELEEISAKIRDFHSRL